MFLVVVGTSWLSLHLPFRNGCPLVFPPRRISFLGTYCSGGTGNIKPIHSIYTISNPRYHNCKNPTIHSKETFQYTVGTLLKNFIGAMTQFSSKLQVSSRDWRLPLNVHLPWAIFWMNVNWVPINWINLGELSGGGNVATFCSIAVSKLFKDITHAYIESCNFFTQQCSTGA